MLKEERHELIKNEVELHNRILLTDIAEQIGVSIDTIRRDVKELDAASQLKKVHGGAISLGFTNYATQNKNIYAQEDKIKIAKKVLMYFLLEDVYLKILKLSLAQTLYISF